MSGSGVRKRRTFRKFSFRGLELEQLLDLSNDELTGLFNARQRRRRTLRGTTQRHLEFIKKLRQKKKNCAVGDRPDPVKTHLRNTIVTPEMVGSVIGIYNGKSFNGVLIMPEMIGHYLAEFSITYKPTRHGRPGIAGATAKFIPL